MGCDFWWQGSIPDPTAQEQALRMFRAFFDADGDWPFVLPDMARTCVTMFGRSILGDPVETESLRGRVAVSYPYNFFGMAPYLIQGESSNLMRRGQIVFDRTDGGRLVSIMEVSMLPRDCKLGQPDVSLVVNPGGYVRAVGEWQCQNVALFLTLLAIRYCPDLDAHDDRLYLGDVRRRLERTGMLDECGAEDLQYGQFVIDYIKAVQDEYDAGERRSREHAGIAPGAPVHDDSPEEVDARSDTDLRERPEKEAKAVSSEGVARPENTEDAPRGTYAAGRVRDEAGAERQARRDIVELHLLPPYMQSLERERRVNTEDPVEVHRHVVLSIRRYLRRSALQITAGDDPFEAFIKIVGAVNRAWRRTATAASCRWSI